MPTFESNFGDVNLPENSDYHNEVFGYELWEEVPDPANPEGPRAIAMRVPAHGMSKVWELVEENYSETVELLSGTASLVVHRGQSQEWTTMPLTPENPTADDLVIEYGDQFCIVADDDVDAVVLSRPSKPFNISFERDITRHPADALSRFIVAHVAAIE